MFVFVLYCIVFIIKSFLLFKTNTIHFQLNIFNIYKEIVKVKGLENITVDDLVEEITPKGRGNLFNKIF